MQVKFAMCPTEVKVRFTSSGARQASSSRALQLALVVLTLGLIDGNSKRPLRAIYDEAVARGASTGTEGLFYDAVEALYRQLHSMGGMHLQSEQVAPSAPTKIDIGIQ